MTHKKDSKSPTQTDISEHYSSGYEAERLISGKGKLDRVRSQELMKRYLPEPPASILDVGGGTGIHACWLAKLGYSVHLVDIVPLHVELAEKASTAQPEVPLASVTLGDACSMDWDDEMVSGYLLFGPLYHLTDENDRLKALREAYRILKRNGVLLAVGISRFASTLDGLSKGFLRDAEFMKIVERDLVDGQHRNPTGKGEYFMDTFFHHPDELKNEVEKAGFDQVQVYGVEGPGWLVQDFDHWWADNNLRDCILHIARRLETEPALLGISAHLMVVGRKP
jgi:ubiquinone/menaquinone biosynthesis C-methylase UbiE